MVEPSSNDFVVFDGNKYIAGEEILEKRTISSKTYYLGEGNFSWEGSIGAIHYKDNLGKWQDIDESFSEPDAFGKKYGKLLYHLQLADDSTRRIYPDRNDLSYWVEFGAPVPDTGLPEKVKKEVWRWKLGTYDFNLTITGSVVKFDIVLHTPSAPTSFTVPFVLEGLTREGFLLKRNGQVVAEIRKPFAIDDKGTYRDVDITFGQDSITLKLVATGLVFPIEIDPTLDLQVGASTDDCQYTWSTSAFAIDSGHQMAGAYDAVDYKIGGGMRFLNVALDQGEDVNEAHLTLRASASKSGTVVNTRISAEDVDDAITFADNAGAFEARWAARTTARVDWDAIPAWTGDSDYDSPDIKTVIKEIVDRGSWVSGNDIVIFWDDFDDRSTHATARRLGYSYDGSTDYSPKLHINYGVSVPALTTGAATSVEETTATLNGNITGIGGSTPTTRGFEWDIDTGAPYANDWHEDGSFGTGSFSHNLTSLVKGELYFYRAYATNGQGTGYGSEVTFLTKPDPPTGFTATAASETQIDLAWTVGSGSDKVYIRGKLGSAPTDRDDGAYSWNGAGVSTSHSGLSVGQHWYYIIWSYCTEGGLEQTSDTPDPADDAITLQPATVTTNAHTGFGSDWAILNGTVDAVNDTSVTEVGFDYGLTNAYGDSWTATGTWANGDDFVGTITGLSAASVFHYRAKAYNTDLAWGYGSDMIFSTEGSATIYEYLKTGGDGDSAAIYSDNVTAQQFTIGNVAHTVTNIRLDLKKVGSPGTVTVVIKHANDSNEPTGLDLCSGTLDGDAFSTSYTWHEFTVDETGLEDNSKYAVVVSAIAGDDSNYVLWQKDTGGGLASAVGSHSSNGGITWSSDNPADYLFEIWGNPVISIESAAVFNNYLATGDMLFVAEIINIYPPYYPFDDSARYFDVQLLDTNGVTYIASTTLKRWGDKPISIYLSADSAVPLTEGSEYYIRLRGSFTGNPSTSYQLQSDDWRGSNLDYLDKWVILTAHSMEDYYDTTYTVLVVDKEILNEAGGVLFDGGIQGLSAVRPGLFQVTINLPQYELPVWTDAFMGAEGWEAQVGVDIVNMVTDAGNIFGLSGKETLAFGLLAMYGALALFLAVKGMPLVALGLALPFILFGAWLRVIDIVVIGLIVAVLAFMFVWKVWWSRT